MKKPFKFVIAVLVALVIGGAIGYFAVGPMLNLITNLSVVKNGPWATSLAIGSTSANPYIRAWVAKHALLALTKSETIYLTAYVDDNGEPLLGNCDYRIESKAPDTRWWSITAYGSDDFLIPNEQMRYSWSCTEMKLEPDGSFRIYLSRTPKEGCWLPAGDAKKLSVTLRLYNPGPVYYDSKTLGTVELPHIVKEGCK
jgi:hypothetical protein